MIVSLNQILSFGIPRSTAKCSGRLPTRFLFYFMSKKDSFIGKFCSDIGNVSMLRFRCILFLTCVFSQVSRKLVLATVGRPPSRDVLQWDPPYELCCSGTRPPPPLFPQETCYIGTPPIERNFQLKFMLKFHLKLCKVYGKIS